MHTSTPYKEHIQFVRASFWLLMLLGCVDNLSESRTCYDDGTHLWVLLENARTDHTITIV